MVCELHFQPEDIGWETTFFDERTGRRLTAKLKKPYLRDGAVPSILPNCPSYLSSSTLYRESPASKKTRREESALQNTIEQSVAEDITYRQQREFHGLDELEGKLNFLDSKYWSVVKQEQSLFLCRLTKSPHLKLVLSLEIEPSCAIHVFFKDIEMHTIGEYKIPSHVNDTNVLEKVLSNMKTLDIEEHVTRPTSAISVLQLVLSLLTILQNQSFKHLHTLKFITEQLYLMTLNKLQYSPELMIFSSLLYNCSPQGYRLLKDSNNLILPNNSSIRRLTLSKCMNPLAEQHDNNFLMYIKNKFKLLSHNDKTVTLMVDEIHIKPYFDYKGGNVVGSAFNCSDAATSAFVFMLNSICSKFRDVVHIMPTKCMKAETLFDVIKQVIIGLEEVGFKVICVLTDNNAINRKALSFFSCPPKLSIVYPHPVQRSRPLFFMFDSVHVLKCIRNNWLGQKDNDKSMTFPQFSSDGKYDSVINILKAPFTTLHKLYSLEADLLLKHSYKLTLKSLSPSNFERQNVNYVLQIFNEYLIQALLTIGKKHALPFFAEVAEYVNTIHIWWTIMNVKTPYKGCRLNNKHAFPLTNDVNDENYRFLSNFCTWLELWDNVKDISGKLTKETFTALKHTTHAMLEMTDYCINELHMKYILTGKFQTDHLEGRFGQYRQLAGGQYNISVRQVFECEKKLRMMSVLQLSLPLHDQNVNLRNFDETNWDDMEKKYKLDFHKINIDVTDDDINGCKEILPVITYLAGYCCYAVFKKLKCNFCKELTTCKESEAKLLPDNHSYIQGINRGSLLYPNEYTTNIVLYNYILISKLTKHNFFHHSVNQRNLAMDISLNVLTDNNVLFPYDFCDGGHSMEKVEKMILWASSNALLNNYCAKENNTITAAKTAAKNLAKKRKLQTLSK